MHLMSISIGPSSQAIVQELPEKSAKATLFLCHVASEKTTSIVQIFGLAGSLKKENSEIWSPDEKQRNKQTQLGWIILKQNTKVFILFFIISFQEKVRDFGAYLYFYLLLVYFLKDKIKYDCE